MIRKECGTWNDKRKQRVKDSHDTDISRTSQAWIWSGYASGNERHYYEIMNELTYRGRSCSR